FLSTSPSTPEFHTFPYTTLFRSRIRQQSPGRGDRLCLRGDSRDGPPAADPEAERVPPSDAHVPRPARDPLLNRSRVNRAPLWSLDRKSTRLNSSHVASSYAVFCL